MSVVPERLLPFQHDHRGAIRIGFLEDLPHVRQGLYPRRILGHQRYGMLLPDPAYCPSDGIAAAQFQPTDARLEITINPSQARMMNSENLRIVRAMMGGRGRSSLMRRSLVPQQQGPYQRTGSHRPKQAAGGAGAHA